MIFHLLDAVLPALIWLLVGFALARLDQPLDHRMVGRLVANIGYPTLTAVALALNTCDTTGADVGASA